MNFAPQEMLWRATPPVSAAVFGQPSKWQGAGESVGR